MHRWELTATAQKDVLSILHWTEEHFGKRASLRYEELLAVAILDVAEDPDRAGSHCRPEIAADARTYHLSLSRDRVRPATNRVKQPRHSLLFRLRSDGIVEILRVFHDSMDFTRR